MIPTPPSCVTCHEPRPGAYCAFCGEKRLETDDRSLRHVMSHGIEAASNVNGKLLLTLRTLFRHPGRLTADYLRGRRQPYLPPLQLFLFANLVFFLLHPLIGSNTLTTALNTHLHYTWHRHLVAALVQARLKQRAVSMETYAPVFDAASVTHAKSFVILVVPIFALAVAVCYARRRQFVDHLVFAMHFCTYWLFLICATLALTNLTIRLLRMVDIFPSAEWVEAAIIIFTLLFMARYLFHAARTVFPRQTTWLTLTKALMLGLAFDVSLQIYRCALFFITFLST